MLMQIIVLDQRCDLAIDETHETLVIGLRTVSSPTTGIDVTIGTYVDAAPRLGQASHSTVSCPVRHAMYGIHHVFPTVWAGRLADPMGEVALAIKRRPLVPSMINQLKSHAQAMCHVLALPYLMAIMIKAYHLPRGSTTCQPEDPGIVDDALPVSVLPIEMMCVFQAI